MGASHSSTSQSQTTDDSKDDIQFIPRERKRHGFVDVKISSVSSSNRANRSTDTFSHRVSPAGAILCGNTASTQGIHRAIANLSSPMLPPVDILVPDNRCTNKLLVTHTDKWNVVPSFEPFSRHTGVCMILGDKSNTMGRYQISLGDCFRLGSVGLVVVEMKLHENDALQRLDSKKLQYLKDEALAFDIGDELAALAIDEEAELRETLHKQKEEHNWNSGIEMTPVSRAGVVAEEVSDASHELGTQSYVSRPDTPSSVATQSLHASPSHHFSPSDEIHMQSGVGGITNGERYVCYMCFEGEESSSNALVAPCECKGDTRYVHVMCLQQWYQSAFNSGAQARVLRTTAAGAPACKICGSAYKSAFKRPSDGRKAALFEMECSGPFISFVVVTRHDNVSLFNTKFRMNFGKLNNELDEVFDDRLVIGRSSGSNMVLDYRTVSQTHVDISYDKGQFFIEDNGSSNGTMVYLQAPISLSYFQPIRIRMGRTTVELEAKRKWTATFRELMQRRLPLLSIGAESSSGAFLVQKGNSRVQRVSGKMKSRVPSLLSTQELYQLMMTASPPSTMYTSESHNRPSRDQSPSRIDASNFRGSEASPQLPISEMSRIVPAEVHVSLRRSRNEDSGIGVNSPSSQSDRAERIQSIDDLIGDSFENACFENFSSSFRELSSHHESSFLTTNRSRPNLAQEARNLNQFQDIQHVDAEENVIVNKNPRDSKEIVSSLMLDEELLHQPEASSSHLALDSPPMEAFIRRSSRQENRADSPEENMNFNANH